MEVPIDSRYRFVVQVCYLARKEVPMARTKKTRESSTMKRPKRSLSRKLTTAVTFTASDLAALADYIAAGMVMLRISTPHRSVSKLKAAMSRLKVPSPRGL